MEPSPNSYHPRMNRTLSKVLALGSLTLAGCAPRAVSTPPAAKNVADAPDEYREISGHLLATLAKRDFAEFSDRVMGSRAVLKQQQEGMMKACPQLFRSPEDKAEAESLLAEYDPAGVAVKKGFDGCASKHDFTSARFVSAAAREHVSNCGSEMADHVEVIVAIGNAKATVVLDDLVRTPAGWRVADAGIYCE